MLCQLLEELAVFFREQSIAIRGSEVCKIQQQAKLLLGIEDCYALLCAYELQPLDSTELALKRALAVKRELIAFGLRPGQIKVLVMYENAQYQQVSGKVVTSVFSPVNPHLSEVLSCSTC